MELKDDTCFPTIPDAYTGSRGLVTVGSHRGCRVLLGTRIQTGGGAWGAKYSRLVKYECACERPRAGWAMLPEGEYVTLAIVVRKQVAA